MIAFILAKYTPIHLKQIHLWDCAHCTTYIRCTPWHQYFSSRFTMNIFNEKHYKNFKNEIMRHTEIYQTWVAINLVLNRWCWCCWRSNCWSSNWLSVTISSLSFSVLPLSYALVSLRQWWHRMPLLVGFLYCPWRPFLFQVLHTTFWVAVTSSSILTLFLGSCLLHLCHVGHQITETHVTTLQ